MNIKTINPNAYCCRVAKRAGFTQISSKQDIQRISSDGGKSWIIQTDKDKKQLKRGQFAFGSLFPYIFDGLSNAATNYKCLLQEKDEYYSKIELPINDFIWLCLDSYTKHNRGYFMHELATRGRTNDEDEAKYLRYIPMATGDYISAPPLIIGFRQKTQKEVLLQSKWERQRNLINFNENSKTITSIFIYVLKILIEPIYNGYDGGWFSCPNALQAKINYILHELKKDKETRFNSLNPLLLRKYYLYLNTQDGSQDPKKPMHLNAIDLWEHVSPSELIVNSGYKYVRNWDGAIDKLNTANEFFDVLHERGLMKGAKAFPTTSNHKNTVWHNKSKQEYAIFFKRDEDALKKKEIIHR